MFRDWQIFSIHDTIEISISPTFRLRYAYCHTSAITSLSVFYLSIQIYRGHMKLLSKETCHARFLYRIDTHVSSANPKKFLHHHRKRSGLFAARLLRGSPFVHRWCIPGIALPAAQSFSSRKSAYSVVRLFLGPLPLRSECMGLWRYARADAHRA